LVLLNFIVTFLKTAVILMEFGITEERKSDLLLQDSSCVQILKTGGGEESK